MTRLGTTGRNKALSALALVLVAALSLWLDDRDASRAPEPQPDNQATTKPATKANAAPGIHRAASPVAQAFAERRSNAILTDNGRVIKILTDDRQGSAHQRFLVQVAAGPVVLIAHNIDLAPRVAGLREGAEVRFKGEYEWSEKGGVVHWTHHDPGGRHPGGWIEHAGERYQ